MIFEIIFLISIELFYQDQSNVDHEGKKGQKRKHEGDDADKEVEKKPENVLMEEKTAESSQGTSTENPNLSAAEYFENPDSLHSLAKGTSETIEKVPIDSAVNIDEPTPPSSPTGVISILQMEAEDESQSLDLDTSVLHEPENSTNEISPSKDLDKSTNSLSSVNTANSTSISDQVDINEESHVGNKNNLNGEVPAEKLVKKEILQNKQRSDSEKESPEKFKIEEEPKVAVIALTILSR